MKPAVLIGFFFGIIVLIGGGVYFGLVKIEKPENFFGKIVPDDFQFVGSVDLKDASPSAGDYSSEDDKKTVGAPAKADKKEKEPKQITVKVISGSIPAPAAPAAASSVSSTAAVQPAAIPVQSPAENAEAALPQNQNSESNVVSSSQNQGDNQSGNQNNVSVLPETNALISEIMAGAEGNADYEFIELYNPTSNPLDLTGWTIKKKSSGGNESTLVSNNTKYGNFKDKKIMPGKYLLLARKDGYDGNVGADILYSESLAYKNNAIVIYNAAGELVEEINWSEIPKGQSIERESFDGEQFKVQPNPNPRNSSY